jgi:hypothetical protein
MSISAQEAKRLAEIKVRNDQAIFSNKKDEVLKKVDILDLEYKLSIEIDSEARDGKTVLTYKTKLEKFSISDHNIRWFKINKQDFVRLLAPMTDRLQARGFKIEIELKEINEDFWLDYGQMGKGWYNDDFWYLFIYVAW